MNKPNEKHQELIGQGYRLIETFSHNNPEVLLTEWLSKKSLVTKIYGAGAGIILGGVGALLGIVVVSGTFEVRFLIEFILGMVAVLLVIPLHELIHGLAYYAVGAKKVQYKAIWKKMVFYAIADGFIADFRSMRIVAFAPVILITFVGILILLFINPVWYAFIIGLLSMHYFSSAGDFAIYNFLYLNGEKEIVTFDDAKLGETYFYVKE